MSRLLVFFALLATGASALAQGQPGYGRTDWGRWAQQQAQLEPVKLEGEVKQMAGGELLVLTNGNETWRVGLAPQTREISFQGEAETSFLKKGMYVQFVAKLNKRGYAQEPIKSLTISTPESLRPKTEAPSDNPMLQGVGKDLFSAPNPEPEKKKGKKPPMPKAPMARPEETDVQVSGPITQIRAGKMTVFSDGESVHAELADDAVVKVNMSELTFVRPGDKVEVDGQMMKDRRGLARAMSISVTAKTPLGDEPKRKPVAKAAEESKKEEFKLD